MARQQGKNKHVKQKSKGQYSKFWVSFIITCNVIFTIAILISFWKTGMEPSILIGAWFSFTTVELWQLARIKKVKIDREISEIKYGDSDYDRGY